MDRQGDASWVEVNRTLWDERVSLHAISDLYDLAGVIEGRDDLRPWEAAELGPLVGKDLVHLQCHIGTDTVALARRGARTVGLDFSEPALSVAADLAAQSNVRVEWVLSDVYQAPTALGHRRFDVVYTGVGALNWLPDLHLWAQVVNELLRPEGILYIYEIHPMWIALIEDGRTIAEDALDAQFAFHRGDEDDGSYAAPDARFLHNDTWERLHAISDLISAVIDAGLVIELFREFDTTPAPTPWLERNDDRLYHFPPGMPRFPLSYSLRARKKPKI